MGERRELALTEAGLLRIWGRGLQFKYVQGRGRGLGCSK